MDPKVNYTAVGLFVVILATALIFIIYWLSSERHKNYNTYLVYMKEAVSGLNVHAPVKFNGVDVGYVDNISIDPEDPQAVRLVLKVEEGIPITQSTVATLMAQGITGITYIGLKAKTPKAPPLKKLPSEPYPVIPSEPSLLVQLNTALRDVTEGLKGISNIFKLVFDKENRQALKTTLANLSKASQQFPEAMKKIRSAAEGISLASTQAKTTMQNSDVVIQNLSQQLLPEVYQAANYLKDTLSNLKVLTSEIKQNPSVIIRGKQPLPCGPGE